MKIYKITPLLINNQNKNQDLKQNNYSTNSIENRFEFPHYDQISFGIRVDKGLERFFEFNKDRMPSTVANYIRTLAKGSNKTPLEVQQEAFAKLNQAKSINDIKRDFPNEDSFKDLIDPDQSKATRGILGTYREDLELLMESGKEILESGENFTVYLVKKIFLEGKTIDEINKDLAKDIDKDFLGLFQYNNKEYSKLIQSSTLKALGIKSPERTYQQSLRYTREGYSDLVGENISKAQRAFWDSLSPEQRTVRAKRTVEKIENWWNSLSLEQKFNMIAEQDSKKAMLDSFKAADAPKTSKNGKIATSENDNPIKNHTHVGSEKLSKDELFGIWAKNNLEIFEAGLTERQKEALNVLKAQKMVNRWKQMTSEEKTAYIEKIKRGTEPLKYTMIDAWNNSKDIILELSLYLKENQIFKPHNVFYSSEEFGEFQSRLMNNFWEMHPDYAEKLGEQIRLSQDKINFARQNGTFEKLKIEIEKERSRRINDIAQLKIKETTKNSSTTVEPIKKPDEIKPVSPKIAEVVKTYQDEFLEVYNNSLFGQIKSQPKKYMEEYPKEILKLLPEESVRLWTRLLKGERLTDEEVVNLQLAVKTENVNISKMNRAFEVALADTIAKITNDPRAYELSQSDLKMVMAHIENGDKHISIVSHKNYGIQYDFDVVLSPKQIDKKRIDSLYEQFYGDISEEEVNKIIENYFVIKKDGYSTEEISKAIKDMKKYIESYGKSINIIFSRKSLYPRDIKEAFINKFILASPEDVRKQDIISPLITSAKDIKTEEIISHMRYQFSKKYSFLPASFQDIYMDSFAKCIRLSKDDNTVKMLKLACEPRKVATDQNRIMILRSIMNTDGYKNEILAMEQALADTLYEATGDPVVYSLKLETLMDKLELFSLVKRFPTSESPCFYDKQDYNVMISVKKRPNTKIIGHKYEQYLKQIKEYEKELKGKTPENYNEILYILNPNADASAIDWFTSLRMDSLGLKAVLD